MGVWIQWIGMEWNVDNLDGFDKLTPFYNKANAKLYDLNLATLV